MKIQDKLNMDKQGLIENGPITIVAFGDSVTHGALSGEIDQETVYWNLLRHKILQINSYVPVNVINAGISAVTALESVERMNRQVLLYKPDLIIVCFGLNDVNRSLEDYLLALRTIFQKGKDADSDMIFMTPNMLNTYVADDTAESLKEYAAVTAEMQNSGRMDRYMQAAVDLATEMGVTVCDCYARWKELSKTQDTTLLLGNRINHPTREMHRLFADCLFETIFHGAVQTATAPQNTMYQR